MKTDKIKEKILKSIEEDFRASDIATIYVEKEDGIPSDVLTALVTEIGADDDEVSFEIMFVPEEGPSDLLYFVSACVFSDAVDERYVGDLAEFVAKANHYIPTGSFSLENNTLVFKMSTTLPADIEEDKIEAVCKAVVASQISLTNLFVRPFLRLSEGLITKEEAFDGLF